MYVCICNVCMHVCIYVCMSAHIMRQKLKHLSVFRKVFGFFRGILKFQFFYVRHDML